MSKLRPGLSITLDDEKSERANRNHEGRIDELQGLPLVNARIVTVQLADGVATPIAHGLGRTPLWVAVSVPRGALSAGFLVETREGVDRSKFAMLTASGYGATITIDLAVS